MANLFTRLQAVKKANGYQTDFGLNGWRWKSSPFDPTDLPGFNLKDVSCQFTPRVSKRHGWTLTVDVEIGLAAGLNTPDELSRAEADVYTVIAQDPRFSALGFDTTCQTDPVESEFIVVQEEKLLAGVRVRLAVYFTTGMWNPFVLTVP